MQADQQCTPANGQAQLRQHHAKKHRPGLESQGFGDIFNGRVQAPQRRGNRQVQEREVGNDRHQHAGEQAVDRRHQADPGIAVDEGRHRQGRRGQQRPPATPRQIRALGQPGQCHTQRDTEGNRQHYQQHGVDQQLAHPWPEHQGHHRGPAGLQGHADDVGNRQQRQQRHQHRQTDHPRATAAREHAARSSTQIGG
ncbi:hypothetical protein D3C76_730260 [compost metagenome]